MCLFLLELFPWGSCLVPPHVVPISASPRHHPINSATVRPEHSRSKSSPSNRMSPARRETGRFQCGSEHRPSMAICYPKISCLIIMFSLNMAKKGQILGPHSHTTPTAPNNGNGGPISESVRVPIHSMDITHILGPTRTTEVLNIKKSRGSGFQTS